MHLAVYTHPDITFAVSKLSQFNDNPSILHLCAAKHLLHYLQGTKDYRISYIITSPTTSIPIGFSDASYASDPDDRKSTSDYIFMMNNGPVTWSSRKQSIVALSTMESEYIALSECTKEAIFIYKLLKSLHYSLQEPLLISRTLMLLYVTSKIM